MPRQRKHKVLARQAGKKKRLQTVDTNVEQIIPGQADGESQRTGSEGPGGANGATGAAEAGSNRKVSGKKAKRLEKYLESKMKKEERRELLAKLAVTTNSVNSKANLAAADDAGPGETATVKSLLMSSRALGQARESKRQRLSRTLKERAAGILAGDGAAEELFERRRLPEDDSDMEEVAEFDDGPVSRVRDENEDRSGGPQSRRVPSPDSKHEKPEEKAVVREPVVAAGLKRPLELDESGRPIIAKKQKRAAVVTKFSLASLAQHEELEKDWEEWSGFESDSAGNDEEKEGSLQKALEGASLSDADSDADSDNSSHPDEETSASEEEEATTGPSSFTAWAQQKINEAAGFQPTGIVQTVLETPKPANFTPRPVEQDPLPQELLPSTNTDRKVFSVHVSRPPEIEKARLELPILADEHRIMDAIHNNDTVIICGATGSGKTTQVPQFLYESGYGTPGSPTPGLIGITQPRRVAAVSMARRVAEELGDRGKSIVAYQIRFEGTVADTTAIKFMTDGVLLRELSQDVGLRRYSAIIIDEAHERSLHTDILVGMLSRVVRLRADMAKEEGATVGPLKLIIMSATLRIDDITRLFGRSPPPVLEVEGRQFPVTVHFARRTHSDYVEEAFRKVSKGHRKLPPGGFLVFLTGRDEILRLSSRLRAEFGGVNVADMTKVRISAAEASFEAEDVEFGHVKEVDSSEDDLDESDDDDEDFNVEVEDGEETQGPTKMHILPLYGLLPVKEQARVFREPPPNTRLVILATNVAETSLTIPGIRYVFDCGRSKERQHPRDGVQSFEIGWISKASASQRSGRAGRTAPGHCYRLYSSAVYESEFPEHSVPEIQRSPIEGVVLQLKDMGFRDVVNFPFPTPPDRERLAKAEKILSYLAAISASGEVTEIGRKMAVFPVAPRFARMLLVGFLHSCTHYTVALVAALSSPEIFLSEQEALPPEPQGDGHDKGGDDDDSALRTNAVVIAEDGRAAVRRAYSRVQQYFRSLDDKSDALKLLMVVGAFADEPTEDWCRRHFVRFKVLREVQQLRRQLVDLLRSATGMTQFATLEPLRDAGCFERPTDAQLAALKLVVAASYVDQVAIRADRSPHPPEGARKPTRAIDVPYYPLLPLDPDPSSSRADSGSAGPTPIYIHPSSSMAHLSPSECPTYVVYSHLHRGSSLNSGPTKTRMSPLTDVSGADLARLAKGTPLISYSKPLKVAGSGGGGTGGETTETRDVWVVPTLRAEGGGAGWELPPCKVRQRRVPGRGWVVE